MSRLNMKRSQSEQLPVPTKNNRNLSLDTTVTKTTNNNLPALRTPGWHTEYDPILGLKYVNYKTGQIQFDSPDEVMVSPTDYNVADHRKVFSSALKRSLSPKIFSHTNVGSSRSPSPTSGVPEYDIPVTNTSSSLPKLKKISSSLFSFGGSRSRENSNATPYSLRKVDDDDEEEFKKHLHMEMLDYENQRIQKH